MTILSLPEDRFVAGSLPLYADISLVAAERHAQAALLPDGDFSFAAGSPTVPLTVDEFARAALDYPIVFVGPARRAFAVTSLSADANRFIDDAGSYRPGAYIPAYLRRHPFALVNDPANGQWVLGIDEFSTRLAPLDAPGALPLFQAGEPSAATREAVAFCEAYEAGNQRTERLVEVLDELDLFEARQAHHRPRLPDGSEGEPVLLLDYVAVSRARLDALDDVAFARLRARDGLGAVYAHLMSEAAWDKLTIASGADGAGG
jgi:hypothetical protein